MIPESTKSYSIFLEITTDTLNKNLERQGNVNSLWLTADTNIWLLYFFSLQLEFLKNSQEIFSTILMFYSPVAQEMPNTFVYHDVCPGYLYSISGQNTSMSFSLPSLIRPGMLSLRVKWCNNTSSYPWFQKAQNLTLFSWK